MNIVLRVAGRGEGVTDDGRHIAFAAPGDTVTDDGFVTPGPHHATPPCRHFPECGGCQLQHLDDASWSDFLGDRISYALAAQGLETEVRVPSLSPPRTRRRASLHFDPAGRLGFSIEKSHQLVDLTECHVLAPELFALLRPLKRLLLSFRAKRRLDLQLTIADQGVDVLVTGVAPEGLAAHEAITAFAQGHGVARIAFDEGYGAETRWEPDAATMTLGQVPVPLPPGAFLQATREGEAALVAAVREAVGDTRVAADLFSGLGTFALALPGRVYAAEGNRDAILALKAGAGRAQRAVFADHRDLYRRPLTVAELDRFDAIVLDPPRAGAREQAEALAACAVPRIAYVSCNPSSFARDAKMLCEGGYRLDWVQPVGQFRWSTHVELAARFSR
ncbi:RNA methyltransferase [Sphingomonas sp. Leaf412]|uniref:class I SAM-dependent RNA methyltransferase n=1 Tax=Sphingomonas sp. Leaf412 TaxID=1736370 RepID=UPI00070031A8|nr:class I SAM-dependent RNA methyltransferase [Sphingomonas sp. Leaf412]KQT32667.1 RNA methyltransferase [Sphingomonas sp. Leaf412]